MPKALVIGDVIADTLVSYSGEYRFDTDTPARISQHWGGSGANFACWLASFGVETEFIGRISARDQQSVESDLQNFGVESKCQVDQELETGQIVVLSSPGGRSFFTDRGANQALDLAAIQEFPELVYISGYTMFSNPAGFSDLIARAKVAGAMVVCDPGSAGFLSDVGAPTFLGATKGVDLVTPALGEGVVLTGEKDPGVIVSMLGQHYPMVALTLGEAGAMVIAESDASLLPAPKVNAVDPTGAGDAMAARLCAGLIQGEKFLEAAKHAVIAGSRAVTVVGGRPN